MENDLINALFEFAGAIAASFSVRKAYRDKSVAGVHWFSPAFFFSWGVWNLYYYPALDQMLSFYAGMLLALVNAIWIAQLLWYGRHHLRSSRAFQT